WYCPDLAGSRLAAPPRVDYVAPVGSRSRAKTRTRVAISTSGAPQCSAAVAADASVGCRSRTVSYILLYIVWTEQFMGCSCSRFLSRVLIEGRRSLAPTGRLS